MKSWYIVIMVVLLEASISHAADGPGFQTPTCDQALIRKIKTFWGGVGTPQKVLQTIEDGGEYVLTMNTFKFLNRENKCITLNAKTSTNVLNVTATPLQNDQSVTSIDYHFEGESGILPDKYWKHDSYFLFLGNNVLACYFCSENEGIKGAPNGYIAVSRKSSSDGCSQATLKHATGLMEMLGFNFIYKYSDECLK